MRMPMAGARRFAALAQHEAVVTGLLDAAEIERIALLRRHNEADDFGVEVAARRQILHRQDDMARRVMRKSGFEIGLWQIHSFVSMLARGIAPAAKAQGGKGGQQRQHRQIGNHKGRNAPVQASAAEYRAASH